MTRKKRVTAARIVQAGLWDQTADMPQTPWQERIEAELRMQGWADMPDELLAWLRIQAGELASSYPESFAERKRNGKKAVVLFSLSCPHDDEPACFGHWPSAGVVNSGVGIAIELPERPRQVKSSRFINVIEQGLVSERYFLSPHAARGILRRCALMKRPLFPPLQHALEILAREGERENKGEER